jgi:O-antigen/teichoic acid export membrane protein
MILAVSKVWSQLCGLVILILGAHYLSVTEFGIYALASAISMTLNQWVGVGSYEYVIREVNDDKAPSTAFWFNTLAALAFTALGCLLAAPASQIYRAPELNLLILIMSPLAIPAGWRSVGESLLIRRNQLGAAGVASIIQETLAIGAAVWALLNGYGLWSLAVHKCAQFILSPFIYLALARWLPSFIWRREDVSAIMRLGAPLTFDRALAFFGSYGADLILGLLMSPAAVGVYRIGVRIVTAVQFVIYETLRSRAWAKLTVAASQSRTLLAQSAERILGQAWLIFAPTFAGLALTVDLLISLSLGPGWETSADVARMLCIASLGLPTLIVMEPLGAIHKRMVSLLILRIATMAVLLPAIFIAATQGPTTVAFVQAGVSMLMAIVAVIMQQRLFSMKWDASLTELAVSAVGCAFLSAGVLGVRVLFEPIATSPFMLGVELAACVVAGAVLYAAALFVVRRLFVRTLFESWAS